MSSLGGISSGSAQAEQWALERSAVRRLMPVTLLVFAIISFLGSVAVAQAAPKSPTVTIESASAVGETTATLNASINPNGTDTKYVFRVSTEEPGEIIPCEVGYEETNEMDVGSGTKPVKVSDHLTELEPGKMYCYDVVAYRVEYDEETGEIEPVEEQCEGQESVCSSEVSFTTAGSPPPPPPPVPPSSATGSAEVVNETEAILRGVVYPNRSDTHYYFEYGTSEKYGSIAPALPGGDAGAGPGEVAVSVRIGGLYEGTTYYYRLVAVSAGGESHGEPETVTPPPPRTTNSTVREPISSKQWEYYRGTEGQVWEAFWNGSTWANYDLGGNVAPGTTPTVRREQITGDQWVYYTASNSELRYWEWTGTEWRNGPVPKATAALGSSPTAVQERVPNQQWVYYRGTNGAVWQAYWSGSEWEVKEIGGQIAANTSPTVIRDPQSERQWIVYTGSNAVYSLEWTGTKWVNGGLPGVAPTAGTSPTVARSPVSEEIWVYYVGGTGEIYSSVWTGKEWANGPTGGKGAAPGASPSVVRDPETGQEWVYYVGTNFEIHLSEWNYGERKWNNGPLPGSAARTTNLAPIYEANELWVDYYGLNPSVSQAHWKGTEWGNSEVAKLAPEQLTATSSTVRESSNGDQWDYYRGSEGQVWEAFWNGSTWSNHDLGGSVAPGTTPTVRREEATGNQWVYYTASNSELRYWEWNTTRKEWLGGSVTGAAAALGSSPTAVSETVTNQQWVYYRGTNGAVWEAYWSGAAWTVKELGGYVVAGTSLTVIRDAQSGKQWVFYTGSNAVYNWEWNGEKWVNGGLPGVAPTAGTSPTAVRSPASGEIWVYYVGGTGEIYYLWWSGKEWVSKGTTGGNGVATGASPSVVRDAETGQQWVYYVGSNFEIHYSEWNAGKWNNGPLPGSTARTTSLAPIYEAGELWVDYYGTNPSLWQAHWEGTKWGNKEVSKFAPEWVLQSTPSPSGSSEGTLHSVSCTTSTACSGVGWDKNSSGTWVTLGERWNGTEWVLQSTPNPSGAKESFLVGVSCSTAAACVGAGSYKNSSGISTLLVEAWNGTEWVIQTTPSPSGAKESRLRDVSCSSSTACTAVGNYTNSSGTVVTLAERWNGTEWTVQSTPNPSGATESRFESVSCSTSTACSAVGSYKNSSGTQVTLAERWNGTEWTVQSTPNPSGAKESFLRGVSCTSSSACTGVGYYTISTGQLLTLAERWNGTEWVIQSTPNPTGTINTLLEGVSCTSSTSCTATSEYQNSATTWATLAEVWNGTEWSIQATANPSGETSAGLHDVWCVSASQCTGVGYSKNSTSSGPIAERITSTPKWSLQSTPSPSGSSEGTLHSVSCTTSTACSGVGWDKNSSGTWVTLGERWNGTEWVLQSTPNPSGAKESFLVGVSCSTAAACVGAGSYKNSSGISTLLVEAWNGTEWVIQTTPSPSGAKESRLRDVSCSSSTACTAVGNYTNSSGTVVTLAERWNGTEWTVQSTPNPSGATESRFESVSCSTSTACSAVGSYKNSSGTQVTLAERWNGTEWTVQSTPNPSGAKESFLRGVSCTSSSACTGVGYYTISTGQLLTLAERWNGTEWVIQSTPNPTGTINTLLEGVSCTSSTSCTATSEYQNSATTWATLAEVWNGTEWSIQATANPSGETSAGLHDVWCVSASQCTGVGYSKNSTSSGPIAEVYQ
jgi:hypothetical protein